MLPEVFEKWCAIYGAVSRPAAPATIAEFIGTVAPLGIDAVWPIVQEISRAHYTMGLADPTLGGAVSAALNTIAPVDPPRSWRKTLKVRFRVLPYDLQVCVAEREKDRDKTVTRALNLIASIVRKPKQGTASEEARTTH